MQHNNERIPNMLILTSSSTAAILSFCRKQTPASGMVSHRNILSLAFRINERLSGALQRVIEAGRIAIAAIPYELAWGEVNSAEDLMAYQETCTPGAIKC